jgi:hypothetical protein
MQFTDDPCFNLPWNDDNRVMLSVSECSAVYRVMFVGRESKLAVVDMRDHQ